MFMQMTLLLWAEIAIQWQAKTNWVEKSGTCKQRAGKRYVIYINTSYTVKSVLGKNVSR